MLGQSRLDVLDLQRLPEIPDNLHGLVAGHLDPFELLVGRDDSLHLGLDQRNVVVRDRPAGPHVVIEAGAHGRPEGQFDAVEEPHHGAGHHMGRRVTHHGQCPRVTGHEQFERHLTGRGQRCVEPHGLAVEQGRDRPRLSRALSRRGQSHFGNDIGHPRSLWILTNDAIGKTDGGHGGSLGQRVDRKGRNRRGWRQNSGFCDARTVSPQRPGRQGRSAPQRPLRPTHSTLDSPHIRRETQYSTARAISSVG